jgi:hypothetical protein
MFFSTAAFTHEPKREVIANPVYLSLARQIWMEPGRSIPSQLCFLVSGSIFVV